MEDALQTMVLISDGNSEHVAHVWKNKSLKMINLCRLLSNLNECLMHIKLPISPPTCAPISELPTNISNMMTDEDVVQKHSFQT